MLVTNGGAGDMGTNVFSHDIGGKPFDLARCGPGAANWLPIESASNLVDCLALAVPLEREEVKVVAEGDQPARQTSVGGLDGPNLCADVGIASPREEGEASRSTGDHGELLVGHENVLLLRHSFDLGEIAHRQLGQEVTRVFSYLRTTW